MSAMKSKVIGSEMVKPAAATPTNPMWISNMDAIVATYHVSTVYYYRWNGAHDFFDAAIFKASLSRALVEFYPFAGRLSKDVNGRIEINCNAEGALFVEAECDAAVDDFADGLPKPEMNLVPKVDYSQGISTFPLLLVQVSRFKCGGVGFGFSYEHHVTDGTGKNNFIAAWSEIARGVGISTKPFLDRRQLAARNPPQPQFPHVEYQPPPTLKIPKQNSEPIFSILKLTRDKLIALKAKCQDDDDEGSTVKYTTFETFAGHVWRCVSKARGLPEEQETRLSITVDGRSRLRPPLPRGYLGNVIFKATAVALCGELESNPLGFAVRKIHDAIARMDDAYLRSAIDHLEVQAHVDPFLRCPNLSLTSWTKFGFYDVDFGWGRPVIFGSDRATPEGLAVALTGPDNDGSLLLAITLPKLEHMLFRNLFYDIASSHIWAQPTL